MGQHIDKTEPESINWTDNRREKSSKQYLSPQQASKAQLEGVNQQGLETNKHDHLQ